MNNAELSPDIIEQVNSAEGKALAEKFLANGTPVLAKANNLIYRAFRRPYLPIPDATVLVILANGWYYPTPEVKLYFESVGGGKYRLMQNNGSITYGLLTYHTATWNSGLGIAHEGDTITIEDGFGVHTVNVESF